jgi:hypothetical protein
MPLQVEVRDVQAARVGPVPGGAPRSRDLMRNRHPSTNPLDESAKGSLVQAEAVQTRPVEGAK